MPDVTVRIDTDAARKRIDEITSKSLKKAILRGGDVAGGMVVTKVKEEVDATEPKFMRRRAHGLVKDFRRFQRILRARWAGDGGKSTVGSRTRYALPLEQGGRYEQVVNPYRRVRQLRGYRGQTRTISETVKTHKRHRTERIGRFYLKRALDAVLPIADQPMTRALAAALAGEKIPTQAQLRKGL